MRISGSPPLRSSEASACSSVPSLRVSTIFPVTSRPHAAALTNSDGDAPTCVDQSPAADLVADQPVARGRIRDAQQRLGEAHQRDAFAAVERELEHQRIDAAGVRALGAHRRGKRRRQRLRPRELVRREARFGDQRADGLTLVGPVGGGDALAQRREGVVRIRAVEGEIECGGHDVLRLPTEQGMLEQA